MMKMHWAVWIGIIAGLAGLAIGVASAFTMTGEAGPYIGTGMLVVFGGMFFLFYKLLIGPMMNTSRLQKHGISAVAKILEVKDTGVTINNNPQVKLVLEIKNNLGQIYETTCRALVSRINPGMFQPGMGVPVKIDPKNEKNVVIDYSGGGQQAAAAAQQTPPVNEELLRAELEALQQKHDLLMATGEPARAIIKTCSFLGALVNGNNPYVELEVEVLPENGSSFSAVFKAVIGEQRQHLYQPGKEIPVKYDRYDTSKVFIDTTRRNG